MSDHIHMYLLTLTKNTRFTHTHLTTQFKHVLHALHTHTLTHSILPPQLLRGQLHSIRAISTAMTSVRAIPTDRPIQRIGQRSGKGQTKQTHLRY
jgi:hypothetical protein